MTLVKIPEQFFINKVKIVCQCFYNNNNNDVVYVYLSSSVMLLHIGNDSKALEQLSVRAMALFLPAYFYLPFLQWQNHCTCLSSRIVQTGSINYQKSIHGYTINCLVVVIKFKTLCIAVNKKVFNNSYCEIINNLLSTFLYLYNF